tara:strand:- start:4 stop:1911 length:1908 start_codon:yes stop_codon:yes gene_type:complete
VFGDLIGYGDYGFVYEDETETNGPDGSVVKIMPMSNVCNQQQYNLFKQLENQQNQGIRTPGLPFVFATFRGQMNANVLNVLSYATSDAQAKSKIRRDFPLNSEYGIVIMERLPCVAANQFCGRNLRDTNNQLEEQSVYESMVTYLYDTGWWVRDLIDPRNVGYNIHGEPVWFDPMVARRQGFPGFSQAALEQCHEEVVAYPASYRKAIESGEYFTQRHGYGLFHSEAMNAYLYNHRLGWKVEGDINSLNERRSSFPHAINYASHNYTPKGFFGLGDLFGADSYISQDYPQCYLCGLPAKQEVLTAVGMRNFCSNKCRGEYEGIDYGPDDYYVSPPLEHKLEVVSYDRGDADYDYQRDAKATISCRNCSFSEDLSFYQPHQKLRGDWHLQRDEDGDQIPKQFVEDCDHEMEVVKYIYSDWEYPGVITVRCRKCNLADEIRVANLPEGCDNRGKPVTPIYFGAENYNLQALLDILTDRDWDDIEWSDNEPRPRTIGPDDWGEDVEWNNKYISTTGIFYSPAGRIGLQLRSAQVMSPNTWSGISGFLDAGETPYEAVVREIHEESGLPMEVIKTWRYRVIWDNGLHRTYLFYVDTEFEPEVNEFKWEWDDWRWDTMDAWKRVPNLHPGMIAALQEASE